MAQTNPFWEFSLELYGHAGVAPACIALQEEHGMDVNLLLLCCWRAWEGYPLQAPDLQALEVATAGWREEVLLPIRSLRMQLRDRADAESCRDYLIQAELEAERLQQQTLYAVQLSHCREGESADAAAVLEHNLGELATLYGLSAETLAGASVAVRAAFTILRSGPPAG